MDDFYRDYILDHYRSPRNFGTLEQPDAAAEDVNPLCGDQIRVELKLDDGEISDVRFSGKGCAISQASTSMLTGTRQGNEARRRREVTQGCRLGERRDRHQSDPHEVCDAISTSYGDGPGITPLFINGRTQPK